MLIRLLLLFTVVPMVELLLLLRIGQRIGAEYTVLLILATGAIGATLARYQGLRTWRRIQDQVAHGEMPTKELLNGLMILVAGALLVTPGVITDGIGFLLLLPPTRALLRRYLSRYYKSQLVIMHPHLDFEPPEREKVVDVVVREVNEPANKNQ